MGIRHQALDLATNQLRHDLAACKTLPLNGLEKNLPL